MTTFVGLCSIDLYSDIDHLPNYGETFKGNSLARGFGGKSSNACAQYAFLTSEETQKPQLLTCVGNDSNGKAIVDHFNEIGIDTSMVDVVENQPTGLAICFVIKSESAIVIHPCYPTIDMVRKYKESIKKSKFLVTNFEMPVNVTVETLKIAKELGVKTILNASPVPENLDLDIFKNVSIAIVNQVELNAIGNVEKLLDYGVELVIVTLGSNGADLFQKGKEKVHVQSPKVKAVDTTGAGDCFLGSFAYCISKSVDYESAAKFACVCASISVQSVGTQQSYPHFDHPEIRSIIPK